MPALPPVVVKLLEQEAGEILARLLAAEKAHLPALLAQYEQRLVQLAERVSEEVAAKIKAALAPKAAELATAPAVPATEPAEPPAK